MVSESCVAIHGDVCPRRWRVSPHRPRQRCVFPWTASASCIPVDGVYVPLNGVCMCDPIDDMCVLIDGVSIECPCSQRLCPRQWHACPQGWRLHVCPHRVCPHTSIPKSIATALCIPLDNMYIPVAGVSVSLSMMDAGVPRQSERVSPLMVSASYVCPRRWRMCPHRQHQLRISPSMVSASWAPSTVSVLCVPIDGIMCPRRWRVCPSAVYTH